MNHRLILILLGLGASAGALAAAPPTAADPAARAASADVQNAEPAVAAPAAPAKPAARTAKAAPGAAKAGSGTAQDRIELETTQITGNRELPKVMVIVPWKHADIGDLAGRPANSLVDEALRPVDRDAFRRELAYFDAISSDRPRSETPVTAPRRDGGPEK
jgi:hypothetical protein